MKTIAYARLPNDKEREEFKRSVPKFPGCMEETEFEFDGLAGQLGLTNTIQKARSPGVAYVVVQRFSDLGRDVASAIRNAHELLFEAKVEVIIQYRGSLDNTLVSELHDALGYYATLNRKLGIETARSSGAQIGRPRGITWETVRKVVTELMNAKEPEPVSVRDVAKEIAEKVPEAKGKCSLGKASDFLKAAKQQRQNDELSQAIAEGYSG